MATSTNAARGGRGLNVRHAALIGVGVRRAVVAACAALLVVACGDDDGSEADPVAAAQARVAEAEDELAEARDAFDEASVTFCDDGADYIESVDRYGGLFSDDEATVGDVTTAGADLEEPREAVGSSADEVLTARDRVVAAEQELADAEAALGEAQSGTSAAETTTTTTAPLVPAASVERVDQAEDNLASAFEGVTASTPLSDATEQVNAAAYAVQVSSLRLLADAGCLTEDQEQEAVAAVASYTTAIQTSLTTAGYLEGEIDGIYGPATVEAVEQLQTDSDLPVTGLVDQATAVALDEAVAAAGGDAAAAEIAHTAALQAALTLAGFWTGPIDGEWTDDLTAALQDLQTDLGIPPTGVVDAATLAAVERAVTEAQAAPDDEDDGGAETAPEDKDDDGTTTTEP